MWNEYLWVSYHNLVAVALLPNHQLCEKKLFFVKNIFTLGVKCWSGVCSIYTEEFLLHLPNALFIYSHTMAFAIFKPLLGCQAYTSISWRITPHIFSAQRSLNKNKMREMFLSSLSPLLLKELTAATGQIVLHSCCRFVKPTIQLFLDALASLRPMLERNNHRIHQLFEI